MAGKPNGSYEIWPLFDFHFLEWAMRKSIFQNGQEMSWAFWKVFNSNEVVSTVKMARDAGFKGNRLSQWAERIGFNLNHHNSFSDTQCALEVFKYLVSL